MGKRKDLVRKHTHTYVHTCIHMMSQLTTRALFLPLVLPPVGIFFILPCIDKFISVDLRTKSFDVPPQRVGL